MVLSCGYGQQQIGDNKKCRRIAGDFDCHTDAAVRRGAHLPIEHIQGFSEPLDGGMYAEEYKGWIARKNETLPIAETIDSFKEYWADAIALVNQTAIPATQHGYGMAAMDNDTSIASYGKSLANFGAAYAATQ